MYILKMVDWGVSLFSVLLMLRLLLPCFPKAKSISWSQYLFRLTEPFLAGLRSLFPFLDGEMDLAPFLGLFVLGCLQRILSIDFLEALQYKHFFTTRSMIDWGFSFYRLLLVVRILGSWVPVLQYHRWMCYVRLWTEPFLELCRRIIPPIGGGLDLSPMLAFFGVDLLQKGVHFCLGTYF